MTDKKRPAKETPPHETSSRPNPKKIEINTPTYNNMTDKKRPAKETPPHETSRRPDPKKSNLYTLILIMIFLT